MSGKKSDSSFLQWLQNVRGSIAAVIAFISLIVSFAISVQSNVSLVVSISIVIGIGIALLACFYFAFFWKPEKEDRSPAIILPSTRTDKPISDYSRKVKQRKAVRRTALGGLILVPLLSIGGFSSWQYIQNLPPDKFLILVTSFEDNNPTDRLSIQIYERLEDLVGGYNDVEVERLSRQFPTVDKEARAIGEQQDASIVIWGSYDEVGEQLVETNANFTLIQPPPDDQVVIDYSDKSRGDAPFQVEELEQVSFSFRNQIAAETNYLTLFTLGLVDYFEDDLDQSIASFDRALEAVKELEDKPELYPSYYYKGNAYLYLENYEQAISSYNEVVSIDPTVKGVLLNRGVALARLEGKEQEALQDINAFIESYPDEIKGHLNQGLIYILLENYTSAIASFDRALKMEPNNDVALVNKGKALMRTGEEEEAIALFDEVIDANPQNAVALRSKAQVLEDQGLHSEALSVYEQVIDIEPENSFAYFKKAGILYEQNNDVAAALEAYNAALEVDPTLFIAAFQKATMFFQEGLYEQSISASDAALALQADQTRSYYTLHTIKGNAFNKLERYEDAISAFDKASEIDSSDVGAPLSRGIALQRLERYVDAAESYELAVTLASSDMKPELYKQIALCYSLGDKPEQAFDSIESYINTTQSIDKEFFDKSGFDSLRGDTRFTELL